jgi:hypothetical protein
MSEKTKTIGFEISLTEDQIESLRNIAVALGLVKRDRGNVSALMATIADLDKNTQDILLAVLLVDLTNKSKKGLTG